MTGVRDRPLAILELLAANPAGLPLSEIAGRLDIPLSATHRLLADLKQSGYVRQDWDHGPHQLTAKLVSLALGYLSASGITDVAQPILNGLAQRVGELVRLAVIDGDRLTWVAKAQGARHGLRYDPDAGAEVHLASTANGHAWLSCLSDEAALELVAKQGFGRPDRVGPGAPRTMPELLERLRFAREHGFAIVHEAYEAATSAMAAPIRRAGGTREPIGTISIAGPSVRMTDARMLEMAPDLLAAVAELSVASRGSSLFGAGPGGYGTGPAKAAE
jgi:DNA-binding IclR family transcriptional regulator